MEVTFAERLEALNLSSGPVYASRLMTGREAAQAVADVKAQHSIRPMTERILKEASTNAR